VYGVITVRDIVFKVISKNLDPHKIKVEEIASKPVISIFCTTMMPTSPSLFSNGNLKLLIVCSCLSGSVYTLISGGSFCAAENTQAHFLLF